MPHAKNRIGKSNDQKLILIEPIAVLSLTSPPKAPPADADEPASPPDPSPCASPNRPPKEDAPTVAAPPMPDDPDADHPKASPPDLPLCWTFRSLLMETFPWAAQPALLRRSAQPVATWHPRE